MGILQQQTAMNNSGIYISQKIMNNESIVPKWCALLLCSKSVCNAMLPGRFGLIPRKKKRQLYKYETLASLLASLGAKRLFLVVTVVLFLTPSLVALSLLVSGRREH